jgi:hypothetical protein
MRRKLVGAMFCISMILAQPASVAATAYAPLTYSNKWWIPGQGVYASVCMQPGIIDVAQNYSQIVIKNWISGSCSGANRNVASGFIGMQLQGLRDGSVCGTTSVYYSTVSTSAWQLWATMCSNPSGSQSFKTFGLGYYWNSLDYNTAGWWASPSQNY